MNRVSEKWVHNMKCLYYLKGCYSAMNLAQYYSMCIEILFTM